MNYVKKSAAVVWTVIVLFLSLNFSTLNASAKNRESFQFSLVTGQTCYMNLCQNPNQIHFDHIVGQCIIRIYVGNSLLDTIICNGSVTNPDSAVIDLSNYSIPYS